ncbi:MAG: ATP-binding protein [Thermoproteus sp.]
METEFTDRDRALAQVAEWAERGTWAPFVIFGPEGCGKTAFLRQAASGLRELGVRRLLPPPPGPGLLGGGGRPRRQGALRRPREEDSGGREVGPPCSGRLRLGEGDP